MAVRTRAGLFDVSHMGEIEIAGKDALAAVQRISCNDASKLQVGQAQYSGLLTPQGTFVDDLLVYRLAPAHFLLVVNAGNIAEGLRLDRRADRSGVGDAVAVDASSRYALIALQGPAALERAAAADRRRPRRASSTTGSRTGKWPTSAPPSRAPATPARTASRSSSRRSRPTGSGRRSSSRARPPTSIPCGLGARDTLRLEAGDAPVRQRHRRDDDRCSKRIWAGSSAGRRTTSSARRRCASRRRAASRARSSASRCSIAASRATATTSTSATRRPASSPAARRRRS